MSSREAPVGAEGPGQLPSLPPPLNPALNGVALFCWLKTMCQSSSRLTCVQERFFNISGRPMLPGMRTLAAGASCDGGSWTTIVIKFCLKFSPVIHKMSEKTGIWKYTSAKTKIGRKWYKDSPRHGRYTRRNSSDNATLSWKIFCLICLDWTLSAVDLKTTHAEFVCKKQKQ